ncbi:hypothetical protein CERZMDRAFT_94748 [Cercospora zeae-maydis SCOH1-5]|uniref:Uncharacterized protein n=1 Tax=Cercospora zeae-maydis SCOH1-5 TaxID=717836 RepID=A0A6A6FPI6_9PEZI|nr:hypothetical protein CERZMDRAFT_94748 [Cercospora zeae-maydis SCOH1-5]
MPPKPTKAQLAAAGFGGNTTAADRRRRQERQANLAALSSRGGESSQPGEKSLPGQQQRQQAEKAGPSSLPPSQPAPTTPAPAPTSAPVSPADPAPAFAYPRKAQTQIIPEMRPGQSTFHIIPSFLHSFIDLIPTLVQTWLPADTMSAEGEIGERLRQANLKIGELQEAVADLYDKCAEKDQQLEEVGRENDALTRKNADLNRLNSTLASNNKDAAEAASRSEAELSKEKEAHSKTAAELAESKQKEAELRQVSSNLRQDFKTEREEKNTIRGERDELEADYKLAQRDLDALQKQLDEHDDAAKARAFLEVIHEEVEEQFAQEGKDLTPDNFAAHFRRVSEQAALNHGVSADSSNPQPQDDADPKRRGTGDRVTSVAQELDAVQQQFDSDDESNAANGTDDLHIPKRRPFSTSDDISTSAYTITEQKQKIQDLIRENEKMRAEQAKEVEQLRNQIAKLEEEIDRSEKRDSQYQAELARQQAHIEEREQHYQDLLNDNNAHVSKLESTIYEVRKYDRLKARVNERAALREAQVDNSSETEEEKLEKAEVDKIQPWQVSPTFEWTEMGLSKPTTSDADTQTVEPEPATPATATSSVVCSPTQVVRYTEKVRDATLFEAFNRSPFWLQILLALTILLLLTFGLRGWHQENMWRAANGPALHQIRYGQAQRAIMGNFWSILENFVGYDSHLLG